MSTPRNTTSPGWSVTGLLEREGTRLRVTPRGQLVLRAVAAPFDTYHRADARLHAPAI